MFRNKLNNKANIIIIIKGKIFLLLEASNDLNVVENMVLDW